MTEYKLGLSGTTLKYVAIIAMTVDHIAWAFIKTPTMLGQSMHIIGRLTVVIMSLFIAEGYVNTRSFKRYLLRLIVFACLSQPFYLAFSLHGAVRPLELKNYFDFNIIFNLALALSALKIYDSKQINSVFKAIIITVLCSLSMFCDWAFVPIMLVLIFHCTREDKKKRTAMFIPACIIAFIFYLTRFMVNNNCSFSLAIRYEFMMLGLLLGIIPIYLYNGKRGGKSKFSKWIFYIYYPAHLAVATLLEQIIK